MGQKPAWVREKSMLQEGPGEIVGAESAEDEAAELEDEKELDELMKNGTVSIHFPTGEDVNVPASDTTLINDLKKKTSLATSMIEANQSSGHACGTLTFSVPATGYTC